VSIPSWGSSAAAASSSSAPTIQIAIRPSQTDTATSGSPAVTSVGAAPLHLRMQPERMILAAVTSADGSRFDYLSCGRKCCKLA